MVVELKQKQSANEMVELKQIIAQLEVENTHMQKMVAQLQEKRVSSKDLFGLNEMHQSYLSIMKEREKVIESLT